MKIKKVKPARLYSRKKNPELKRILLRVLIVLVVAAAAILIPVIIKRKK